MDNIPRWDSRNDMDRKLLEEWTNSKLDALEDEDSYDFDVLVASLTDKEFGKWERDTSVLVAPPLISATIKSKNINALVELCRSRSLCRMVFQQLFGKTARGRKADTSGATRSALLADASKDVDRVRMIWKAHYGLRNRRHAPTAVEIVARRWQRRGWARITGDALQDYKRKNG
jgi:hypothetical protein